MYVPIVDVFLTFDVGARNLFVATLIINPQPEIVPCLEQSR
jgi:hypothetical protein